MLKRFTLCNCPFGSSDIECQATVLIVPTNCPKYRVILFAENLTIFFLQKCRKSHNFDHFAENLTIYFCRNAENLTI